MPASSSRGKSSRRAKKTKVSTTNSLFGAVILFTFVAGCNPGSVPVDSPSKTTFGSSGNFFAQLSNKAPLDIFFSADIGYPRKLIEQGDGLKETEFSYAVGHLGIWVRNDSSLDLDKNEITVLSDPAVKKIAIANPRFAPYGRAAEAALKHFEIYESIQDRLVLGDNIAQTAQFVESGAADVGVTTI